MSGCTNLENLRDYIRKNNISLVEDIEEEGIAEEPIKEPEKEYKTMATTGLVTLIAYLIGMNDDKMALHFEEHNMELLDQLKNNKEASIIRYLCRLRTSLFMNFKKTDYEMRYNLQNIDRLEWFSKAEINKLRSWGIEVVQTNSRAENYQESFNQLIHEKIDACKYLFPDWVNWEYVRDLFVVPKRGKKKVLKEEFEKYKGNMNSYPFQCFIHWTPGDYGNILLNDGKFLTVLYAQHDEEFLDRTKYRDAVEGTKKSIYEFIDQSYKVAIVVDCENSDPFKLYGVLKNLDEEETGKIEKIVLYDDYHTSDGWDYLEKLIKIPVEHIEIDRVVDRKSLVDVRMTAGICKSFYSEHVSSFILCSSDSDFWGVISALPDAEFLVLYEYSKTGKEIKDALSLKSIYHCAMDDFYSGNADKLKKLVLRKSLEREAEDIIGRNAWELTKEIHENNHIEATEAELNSFYEKYVKTMRLKIDSEGRFYIDIQE